MKAVKSASETSTKIKTISDSILALIASGVLRNGDRVSSERNLAKEFQVSIGTVQRALQKLEQRGILVREHGRGNFVRGLGASLDAQYVHLRDNAGRNLPLFWQVLRQHRKARATKALIDFFGAETPLSRIDRRIDVDGMFVLFGQLFLSEPAFDSIAAQVTDGTNFRELVADGLGMPVVRVEQSVGFRPAPQDVARELGCEPASPCFLLELRSYSVNDRPVSFQRIYGEPFQGATLVLGGTR